MPPPQLGVGGGRKVGVGGGCNCPEPFYQTAAGLLNGEYKFNLSDFAVNKITA